jgi:hypothetical protein
MKRWFTMLTQTTILGVVIALAWAALHVDTIHAMTVALDERNEYHRRFEELRGEVQVLREEREALARGGFTAERRLRERFLLARVREQVILLEPVEREARSSAESRAAGDAPASDLRAMPQEFLPPSMRARAAESP